MSPTASVAALLCEHATFGWDGDSHHRCRCGAILNDAPWKDALPRWALHVESLLDDTSSEPVPAGSGGVSPARAEGDADA